MKILISDLIKKLEETKKEYGDIPVVHQTAGGIEDNADYMTIGKDSYLYKDEQVLTIV